jgi:hypothetical protein
MRWLIWRELLVVTRTAGFWQATAVYLLVLAAYVVTWGDGIPVVNAASPLQQFITVQGMLLLVVLPWTAARCGTTHRSDVTLIASLAAIKPSQVVLARCAALAGALFMLAASALPLMVVMQQLTASAFADVVSTFPALGALSVFTATLISAALLVFADPLRAWMAATAVTLAVGQAIALNVPAWLAAGLLLGIVSTVTADRRLTYLHGDDLPRG